jgi:DNA-binding beta-propeller fold protein YncE
MTSTNHMSLRLHFWLAAGLLLISAVSAWAQTVVATVTVAGDPQGVAANPVTNKIYVANGGGRTVTVIDGATNSTTTLPADINTLAVAVNEVTNKIYVVSFGNCTPFGNCQSMGSITVIDGVTNSTTKVTDPNANGPHAVAVNEVTNQIYVANFLSGNVTVIDGATNATTTVTDPNAAAIEPVAVAVNPMTNKIYVANNNLDGFSNTTAGNVTVIDGATNSTTTITDPNAITPVAVAVNPITNKIYVANLGNGGSNHGNVTLIDGASNSTTTIAIDPNLLGPQAVAVDQTRNKIYVANANDSVLSGIGGVTVIDGTTDAISTVRDPNAMFPQAVAVDSVTNTIYVANQGCFPPADPCTNPGSTTVINRATNSVATVIDPNARNPTGLTLDPSTDKTYVANVGSGNVTVIDGGATPTTQILSLLLAGNGTGTVTSDPAGVDCPTSCWARFPSGSTVTLTASPDSGYFFSGWSGACTGTGTCNVTMSQDGFVTATFNTSPADFSLSPASTGLNVQPGGQATDTITIAPQNGSFANAIQLSCVVSGPAPMPTCTLSPTSVTPGGNSATSTLTITAPAATAVLAPAGNRRVKSLYALWLPLALGITFVGGSKKLRRGYWVLGGLLVLVLLQVACGGSNSSSGGGTPKTYTVTVTGTSGAIQHTAQVTVTVR